MKRDIISIDENKCDGCGLCVTGCPEGAIQLIDGKARLVSDLFCDGLGACIGECPKKAIKIEKREALPYNEFKVMENIIKCGENTIKAHLKHLKDHNEEKFYSEAIKFLNEKNIKINFENSDSKKDGCASKGCPGSKAIDLSMKAKDTSIKTEEGKRLSYLEQWPIQLHLISPHAQYFVKQDILLAADCTAFTIGDFHKDFLKGKKLIIACPKLDSGIESYILKITALIEESMINTLTVLIMEVPCCNGLLKIVLEAASKTKRKIPIKKIKVSIQGDILEDEWVRY